MDPRIIAGSRVKPAAFLALCLAFVAIGLLMLRDPSEAAYKGWACTLVFGFGALVFAVRVVRPGAIRLDAEGFTYDDLFGRPHRTVWGDVEIFFLLRLPRGGRMIAYNFRLGRAPASRLMGVSRALGADAGIPGMWSLSKARMVDLLNDYRNRASFADRR
jgi:hypothetical protein